MNQEVLRRLNNIVQVGTVTETKCNDGLALARVEILGRVTDFLPVVMVSNSFLKVWLPVQVNEQVLVVSPFGGANGGFIIPSIYHKADKEPSDANGENAIVEIGTVRFECDGESVKVEAKNFKLDFDGNLTITGKITDCEGDLTYHEHDVDCKTCVAQPRP